MEMKEARILCKRHLNFYLGQVSAYCKKKNKTSLCIYVIVFKKNLKVTAWQKKLYNEVNDNFLIVEIILGCEIWW